jgi:hypothetical protein
MSGTPVAISSMSRGGNDVIHPGLDRAPAQPLRHGHSQAREGERVDPGTSRAPCGAGFAKVWFARGFARTCSPG